MRNITLFLTSLICMYRAAVGIGQKKFPIFNWPLHEQAKVYETIEGVTQNQSQPGLSYGEPLYNNMNTLSFDGTRAVDINVGTYNFGERDDYTFTFYMKPLSDDHKEMCFFHYQHNGGGTGLTAMKMAISGANLHISRSTEGNVTEVFTSTETVASNQWQLFAVAVDNSQGKISLNVLDVFKEDLSGGNKDQLFQTPGVLRIGGCFDDALPKFVGSITCLSLFEKKIGQPDLESVDTACKESTYVCYAPTPELTTLLNSATCPSTTSDTSSGTSSTPSGTSSTPSGTSSTPSVTSSTPSGTFSTSSWTSSTQSSRPLPTYFNTARYYGNEITLLSYVMTQDFVPDPNIHTYVAMYPECNIFRCGSRCMMDVTCLSFSLEELSDDLGTCRIYDEAHITGLVALLQSAYYTKQ